MKTKDLRDLGLTDEQVDAIMKLNGLDVNQAKAAAQEEITELKVSMKKYEGYKSNDEYEAIAKELAELKGANAKRERLAKYKALGVIDDEDVYALIDNKFKDAKEEDIKAYLEAHPTFKNGDTQTKSTEPVVEAPKTYKGGFNANKASESTPREKDGIEKALQAMNPNIKF